ncbi:unnamed protein product [Calypogeia fissa]
MWDKENNWPAFEEQAMIQYQAWKAERKPKTILTFLPGIVDAYKSKGYNTDEATFQAKSNWVDTSDEDVSEGHAEDEPDSINFSSETDKALWNDVSIPAKKPSDVVVDPVDKMVEGELLSGTMFPKLVSGREQPSVVDTPEPNSGLQTPSQTRHSSLEDLTNTQVLFGHGSFAGIVLEKPTYMGGRPLSPLDSPLGGEFVVSLDSPGPKEVECKAGNDMSQKNLDTQSSTSMECSHCHTPSTPKTNQSVPETPTSGPMQLPIRPQMYVAPPQSGNSTRAEALHMSQLFTQWISGLPEHQQTFPANILVSQEFSQSFKQRSPFADLIEALPPGSDEGSQMQALFSYVDRRIANATGGVPQLGHQTNCQCPVHHNNGNIGKGT